MDAVSISFVAIALTITLCAAFIAHYFNREVVVLRVLKKTPRLPIHHYRNQELAKVVGKVEFVGEPLVAPLSGRKCAYFSVKVDEKRSTGRGGSTWFNIIKEEVPGKFLIRDGEACALVDTTNISTNIVKDKNYLSGMGMDPSASLHEYLERHQKSSTGFLGFNKHLRYREGILEEGEMVAVVGVCEWREVSNPGLPQKILVIKSGEKPVYLSDDPRTTST